MKALEFDRKKARNSLNQQRRRLEKRGANPDDLQEYFGIPRSISFGALSDAKLKQTWERIKSYPPVTVTSLGQIRASKYVRERLKWDALQPDNSDPWVSSFSASIRSNLFTSSAKANAAKRMKRESTLRETLYGAALAKGHVKLANAVKNLSWKDLRKLLDESAGVFSVHLVPSPSGQRAIADYEQGIIQDADQEFIEQMNSIFTGG